MARAEPEVLPDRLVATVPRPCSSGLPLQEEGATWRRSPQMSSPKTDRLELGGRLGRLYAATRRPPSLRTQRALLAVAAVVFVVGGWYALRSLDIAVQDVRWPAMVIAAVAGVPLSMLANTLEYLLSARILHHHVPLMPALRLTVMSTAANLLPIPGAFLVRVQGLRALGSGYGKALRSTAVIGLVWIGVSTTLAAVLLAAARSWAAAVALSVAGVPLLVAAHVWLRRAVTTAEERRRIAGLTLAVEVFAVMADAGRLFLILVGLGLEASLGQALVLAASNSLASAVGVVPGGFGLRELIAAALAPLVGLPAWAGLAATAIGRVMGIAVLAPVAAALAFGPRRARPTSIRWPRSGKGA